MTQLKPHKYTSELISDMDGSQLGVKAVIHDLEKAIETPVHESKIPKLMVTLNNVRKEKNTSKFGMRTSKLRRTK